ncbi:hypothetical protein Tsubulata_024229 [Turnera subulata]|uniref:Uncharacterized protein n=1 Tax=Turnera subulata TaxID=218843 RepID=A0A9Q0J6I5_9ROSI|nr:hypothetical protein Tsubulata_024229 [Turnera subulata]
MEVVLALRFWVLVLACVVCLSCCSVSALPQEKVSDDPLKFILGEQNSGPWRNGIMDATGAQEAEPPGIVFNDTLILAAKRTNRPDILKGFRRYQGGWNVTNRHYWASVGFTGAAGVILAILWFSAFGLVLVVHYFCSRKMNIKDKGSCLPQKICLIMLILFTCAAATGCILLSVGQVEFYREAIRTLDYVVDRSNFTVQTLRNVTEYLALAKSISVAQVFLPSNVINDIDQMDMDLNTVADTLEEKTGESANKIVKAFRAVRCALVTVAAVMLTLAVLGFLLSILGHQHAVNVFVVSGWLLVAITFILCGGFLILNNAISDTCIAMEEWADNPHASTALTSILACVDSGTTNKTLIQSKVVINDIVNVVNTYIYTFANANPSQTDYNYFNQSGPLMPPLCYPFDSQLQDRQCGPQEVSMANSSMVWQNYTCSVAPSGWCNTTGRVTPDIYRQLVAAVNESFALEHYTPVILSLQDCRFVRDTFLEITSSYCPPLERYLKLVNGGLGSISVGVLLCLVLWILYGNRLQREEEFVRNSSPVNNSNNSNRNDRTVSESNSNNDVPSENNTSQV